MRNIVTFRHALTGAAAASALLGAAAAPVAAAPLRTENSIPDGIERSYEVHYDKVRKLGGRPGRNLVDDGVRKGGDARAARPGEVKRSLGVLERMAAELTAPAASAPAPVASGSAPASTPSTSGTAGSVAANGAAGGGSLGGVAACESGGDPSAVGGGGTYRGKYQFDQQTWQSVGGSGDPAAAPEAEQDARAAQLYSQRGTQAWPVCGR